MSRREPVYEPHPFACIFPMMPDDAIADLCEDIKKHGLEKPGLLFEGKVLDGRNRYKACQMAGVEMRWEDADTLDDPASFDALSYVLSLNLHRRHLTQSQRAQCAAEVAKLRVGRPSAEIVQNCTNTLDEAAEAFSVSRRSVATAKHVADKGAKEVVEAVKSGELPVSVAAKLVDAVPDKAEQKALVKQGAKAVKETVKEKAKPKASEGKCPRGGDHKTVADDDGAYCGKCLEPVDGEAEQAKPPKSEIVAKCEKFWKPLTPTERVFAAAWFNEQL